LRQSRLKRLLRRRRSLLLRRLGWPGRGLLSGRLRGTLLLLRLLLRLGLRRGIGRRLDGTFSSRETLKP
jgi:hypothetical protein